MTTSNWKKAFKQLESKPTIMKKYLKHNKPRDRPTGRTKKSCGRCGRYGAHVSKYGLQLCRACFRDTATQIGFKKYS